MYHTSFAWQKNTPQCTVAMHLINIGSQIQVVQIIYTVQSKQKHIDLGPWTKNISVLIRYFSKPCRHNCQVKVRVNHFMVIFKKKKKKGKRITLWLMEAPSTASNAKQMSSVSSPDNIYLVFKLFVASVSLHFFETIPEETCTEKKIIYKFP